MSSDDYVLVREHDGKFCVTVEYASNDGPSDFPPAENTWNWYSDIASAWNAAQSHYDDPMGMVPEYDIEWDISAEAQQIMDDSANPGTCMGDSVDPDHVETQQFVMVIEVPVNEFECDPDIDLVAYWLSAVIDTEFDNKYDNVTFARPLSEVIAS